jgi:predicted lipid-binding transport protein (Tim44 family)
VARITASLKAYVVDRDGRKVMRKEEKDEDITLHEYWTLARRGDAWIVVSIEQRAEGDHHLDSAVVPSPWSDTSLLQDESLVELAVADGLPPGFTTADLAEVDFDGDARARALDLSLADARFAPDVLEAAARRAVAAWAEAVDGSDEALAEIATPEAMRELLYGSDESRETRTVVRGPGVRRIHIADVDVEAEPATMTVKVEAAGRRYVEDRDTAAVLSGSKDRATAWTEPWTLELNGSDKAPWRLRPGSQR